MHAFKALKNSQCKFGSNLSAIFRQTNVGRVKIIRVIFGWCDSVTANRGFPSFMPDLKSKSISIHLDWHTTPLLNESPIYRNIGDGQFYIFPLQTDKLRWTV